MPARKKKTVADLFAANRAEIHRVWTQGIEDHTSVGALELVGSEVIARDTAELLDALSLAFRAENYSDISAPEFGGVIDLLEALSLSRARLGFSPSETATSVLSLKDAVLENLQAEYGDDRERLHHEIIVMNKVIDQLALVTFEAFVRGRESLIAEQHLALEHSTPVVSIWEGMLLMPLMGIIDTQRAQQVIETLLDAIVRTESRVAILDLTAVPAFDTRVAQHIIKTISAAKMLGAEVIVTGISPDAAQTLTKLGVDLSVLDVRGGLVSGVTAAFEKLGQEVRSVAE